MNVDEPMCKKRKLMRGQYLEEFAEKFKRKIEGSCTNDSHPADSVDCLHASGTWKCSTNRDHVVSMKTDQNSSYFVCDCNQSYYCKHIVATIINILNTQAERAGTCKENRETFQQAMNLLDKLTI